MTSSGSVDIVVDTNVIVSIFSDDPAEIEVAERYRPHLEGCSIAICFQTEAELMTQRSAQGWNEDKLIDILAQFEIVAWSEELLMRYVSLRSEAIRRSRRYGSRQRRMIVGAADGWVAATALLLGCPLVTHDRNLAAQRELIEIITELR